MRIRKFNENVEERKFLEMENTSCPVCGDDSQISVFSSTIDSEGIDGDFDSIFMDYHCKTCDFKWYAEYELTKKIDASTGEKIEPGKPVPKDSYNPNFEIENFGKKYNI